MIGYRGLFGMIERGNVMGLVEYIVIVIGLLIILYAIVAFIYRLVKKEPLWPNFKRMISLIFDGFWGMG